MFKTLLTKFHLERIASSSKTNYWSLDTSNFGQEGGVYHQIGDTCSKVWSHHPYSTWIFDWLPIKVRIQYKIHVADFPIVAGSEVPHISKTSSKDSHPARNLRSKSKSLSVWSPTVTKFYGARTFAVASAELWNSLPDKIKDAETIHSFRRNVKNIFIFAQWLRLIVAGVSYCVSCNLNLSLFILPVPFSLLLPLCIFHS